MAALTGAVSGLFTGFLGGLGILGTNFFQTVALGAFTGFVSGGVGEGLNQLLTFGKINNWDALLGSALSGAIIGAIFSAIGYKIGERLKGLFPGESSSASTGDEWLDYVPEGYRESVKSAFEGTPTVKTLSEDLVVYRYWGGKSLETGSPYFSIRQYVRPGNARRYLALPNKNTAQRMTRFLLRKGITIIRGKVASQAGRIGFGEYAVGGGIQIYIPNPYLAAIIGK